MYWLNFTLNNITMLALVLMVGVVIDDAIVVLENIFRFIEEKKMSPMLAAVQATRDIGLAVMATTLSLIVVFLPVSFMSVDFRPISLLVRRHGRGRNPRFADGQLQPDADDEFPLLRVDHARRPQESPGAGSTCGSKTRYLSLLGWSLRHRVVVVGIAAIVMASSVPLYRWSARNTSLRMWTRASSR